VHKEKKGLKSMLSRLFHIFIIFFKNEL